MNLNNVEYLKKLTIDGEQAAAQAKVREHDAWEVWLTALQESHRQGKITQTDKDALQILVKRHEETENLVQRSERNDDEKRGSCPWCGRDLIVADENEDGSYTCHCGYSFTEEGPLNSQD